MSNIKKLIFIIFSSLLIVKCSADEKYFPNNETRIQNDGFLPLSPNNKWIYENSLGTKEPDGSYKISGDSFKTELTISKVTQNLSSDGNGNHFDYGFSPIDLGRTIGGFISGLDRIVKIGDDYKKKSIIKVEELVDGKLETKYKFELDDHIFLTDKELNRNDIISTKVGTIGNQNENGIYIEYTITSYFIDKLNVMPDRLINSEEERSLFSKFKSIIHTTDSIKIIKLVSKSAGGMKLSGEIKVGIVGGKMTNNYSFDSIDFSGDAKISALGGLINFQNATIFKDEDDTLSVTGLTSVLDFCESIGTITLDDVAQSSSAEFFSNQVLYSRDNYWVKGVGNVKNITSPSVLKANITLTEAELAPGEPFNISAVDPNCINTVNTVEINLTSKSKMGNSFITYPFTIDKRSYIQTLKDYSIRKSLN